MIATAPTKSVRAFSVGHASHTPDLAYFRRRYPETVASLGALPRREEWLRSIWELETRWRKAWETRGGARVVEEVVVKGAPPAGRVAEAEFDVVYAGGAAALLHASALAFGHGRRVLVLCAGAFAKAGENWNLSDGELRELAGAGVFTREEVEAAVLNRYRGGFLKFHDAASRVKAGPLWVRGALDVSVDAGRLVALAAERLRRQKGCAALESLRLVRAYVEPTRVTVEAEGAGGERRFFAARLFADACGRDSAVARQLNEGRAPAHVCTTVGTLARGFTRGAVDFGAGEILVSTEDASEHRQLFWECFAGSFARDECATRLFFYDSVDSPADKSLLSLFERYFESLPAYKQRGAGWRVERPTFGYFPASRLQDGRSRARPSDERVMLLGGAAGGAGVLASRRFGAQVRDLSRAARLTHLALEAGLTDAGALAQICDAGPRVAVAVGLAEFMRPAPKGAPQSVNETLNALMAALAGLDERVRRELFQGRMTFAALRRLVARTARLYPRVFARVREHFGARGTLLWLAGVAEAVWSDGRRRASARGGEDARQSEDPRRRFARLAASYQNGDGAGDSP
jgi:lycopene cyclase CruA